MEFIGYRRRGVLTFIALTFSACYDYAPLNSLPNSTESIVTLPESKLLPRQSELSATELEAIHSKSKVLTDKCLSLHPDIQGQRAALVRCLVNGNDTLWSQSVRDGQRERQELGVYAIHLAEQEDQGLVSRTEAESEYAKYEAKIFENANQSQ